MNKTLVALSLSIALSGCGQKSLDEHVQNANKAIADNDYQTAIIELKNAVKLSPDDANARFLLGKTYLQLRQFASAEKELERALDYGYETSEVVPLLSKVYHRTGEDKGLFKLTAKAKGLKPQQLAELKFYQLKYYVDNGQEEKANALIDELKQIPRGGAYSQLALVYDLILKNNLDGALLQAEQVIEKYPTQRDALKLKAELHLRNAEPIKASDTYAKYIEAYPEDDDVKFIQARLLSELKQESKAEPLVDELLKKYKSQPLLLQLKASARINNNDPEQALEYAERALVVNPEDNSSRLIAGISAHLLNNIEKAESHLSLVASLLPPEHIALRFLADAQLRLGMSLEANETTKRFDSITESEASLMSGIGYALLREGEINKASAILEKQPEQLQAPQALASVGTLKLSLNDVSGIVDLEQALNNAKLNESLNPHQIEITLAQAYLSTKQFDKAEQLAQKWLQDEDMKTKGFGLAARVAQLQGNTAEARSNYERALAEQPDNAALKFILTDFEPTETDQQKSQLLNALEQITNQHPGYVPAYVKHYFLAKQLKQGSRTIELAQQQVQAQPDNQTLKILLAELHRLEGEIKPAIALFEQVNTGQPAPFWKSQILAYLAAEKSQKAQQLIDTWVEKAPNDATAIMGKLSVLKFQNRAKEGLELSSHYISTLGGNRLDIKVLHAYFLIRNNLVAEAEEMIAGFPKQVIESPFVQGLKGQILFSRQQYEAALPILKVAYKATPDVMNTQYVYQTLRRIESEQAADSFLQSHVGDNPNDEVNLLVLGNRMINTDKDEAIKLFTQVVELNPNNPIALNNVAYLLNEKGQYQAALKYAKQAAELQPNNPDILDTVGLIELKLGNHSQALEYLSRANENMGKRFNANIFVNYVEALLANGDKALAQRKIEQTQVDDQKASKKLAELKAKYL